MGGKGGDSKSYKATSSAKAAEALAAKGGSVGFGGFSGIRPVAGFGFGAPAASASAATGPSNADAVELSSQLDGDLAQCLRHMSKKDTTTKMKALQNLKDLLPQKTPADLTLLLQPWIYQFKKLLLDPSKAVRSEAAAIMAAVGSSVGKALAPQLKSVLGPWYLACFDPYSDAAAAAKRSLGEVFPGKKQADALMYCRTEILAHLTTCLNSTPQTLGDPRKDTAEEMEERHERIVAAALAAAAALLTTMQQQQGLNQTDEAETPAAAAAANTTAAAAVQEVQVKLQEILQSLAFFKKHLGAKSLLVRRASYGFVKVLSGAAPELLLECQAAAAPAVLGALQEKEPSNHPAMWEMILSFIQSQQPACWDHVNMQKAFIPRLLAFLRHGCYGSAASSMPALLPLLLLLPRQLLTMQPDKQGLLLAQILEAVWIGAMQHCGAGTAARAAAVAAYEECMHWGFKNAHALCGNAQQQQQQQQYCELLLQQGQFSNVVNAAMSSSNAEGETAAVVVQDLLLLLLLGGSSDPAGSSGSTSTENGSAAAAEADSPLQLKVLVTAISKIAADQLLLSASQQQQQQQSLDVAVVCSRLQDIFDSLSSSSGSSVYSQTVAETLAASCCSVLLPMLQEGQQLLPAASNLAAKLIKEYPAVAAAAAGAGGSSGTVAALVRNGLQSCSSSDSWQQQPAAADLDLLLSCICGSSDPSAAWSEVFSVVAAAAAAGNEAAVVAGWHYVTALLHRFVAAAGARDSSSSSTDGGWSHPGLDGLLLQLMQQLTAAAAGVVAAGSIFSGVFGHSAAAAALGQQQQQHWGLSRSQAAAAGLLGCCLGANEQQQLLLSDNALAAVMQGMHKCLTAMHEAVQQQQDDVDLAAALSASAAVCIAALHMAFEASNHGGSSSSIGSSIWQQQPDALVELLLLLAQLSWGGQQELLLPDLAAAAVDDLSSSDDEADGSSSSSSDSSSSASDLSEDWPQETAAAADDAVPRSAAGLSSSSSSIALHYTAVQQAAGRVWNADLLSTALAELPTAASQQLLLQLQKLLLQGLAAAAATSTAAAADAGLRWGRRAAVVLVGLDSRQQQQQDLLQQLLAAVPNWQQWSSSGSSSSTAVPHALMIQFVSVMVLEAGCNVMVPYSSQYSPGHSRPEIASSESSRQWLLLELVCSAAAAAAASESMPMQQCISAAATAAKQHLLHTTGNSSSTAAAAAARNVFASTLSVLLTSAAAAADGDTAAAAAAKVYCSTLTDLLQQATAAINARARMQQPLLPLLQEFTSKDLTAAAGSFLPVDSATAGSSSSGSSTACPAWILVQLIEVLATAFRFSNDAESCVAASEISNLSVGFVNRALALDPAGSSSSSSSDSMFEALLKLVVACFPQKVGNSHKHHHGHDPAAAAASSSRLTAGYSTALERQALTALLRHACSSTGSAAAAAADLHCKLQLCCVGYCWSDMSAAEWHIVLRDSQQRLTAVRREVDRAAGTLAAAACTAADQLMSSAAAAAADNVMTPSMAIEIIRRLARKGLLQGQTDMTQQLTAAADQAVSGLSKVSLPSLRSSLLLLAAVLQLQQQIQAAGRAPQLDLALQSAWRELLGMLLSLGAAAAIAAACGASVAAVLLQCMQAEGSTWQLLGSCLSNLDTDTVGRVLTTADDKIEMLGVDSVSSCLALLQAPWGGAAAAAVDRQQQHGSCEPLQQLAWQLLLHSDSIAAITHVAAASSSSSDDLPEYGVNDDPATYLIQVGLRPEMAAAVTGVNAWQVSLLHWALLLSHISRLNARRSSPAAVQASRRLTQALRDIPEVVPDLLQKLVSLMGLGSSGSSSSNLAAAAGDSTSDPDLAAPAAALSAAAQAQLSAKLSALCTPGEPWTLHAALQNIGLPISHSGWRLVAAALYRAVLSLLPASARIWFSDLRDRKLISAVETYTTKYESPALLAAEFAAIKRDAAGSAGEVGGSCSFRVTASPAAREVTAVLEIEDGATLELQVKLPAAAPLKAAEVECRNKVGIKDGRLRKWLLSIAVFLRNQNQGVLDAISMWKANLEQEFAGVQPCLICYSVISAANGQLPRLSCKQCSVTFHPACLYKWFRSSGKSTCPHCQAPW